MKDRMITLDGIDFRYRDAQPWVLKDLSLQVPQGKITAVLGPNGTGKTTLLLIILGLLHPDRGIVQLQGRTPRAYSRRELSQLIGLVPQFESLPFNFTILEYVLLGRSPYLKPFQVPGQADEVFCRIAQDLGGNRQGLVVFRVHVTDPGRFDALLPHGGDEWGKGFIHTKKMCGIHISERDICKSLQGGHDQGEIAGCHKISSLPYNFGCNFYQSLDKGHGHVR